MIIVAEAVSCVPCFIFSTSTPNVDLIRGPQAEPLVGGSERRNPLETEIHLAFCCPIKATKLPFCNIVKHQKTPKCVLSCKHYGNKSNLAMRMVSTVQRTFYHHKHLSCASWGQRQGHGEQLPPLSSLAPPMLGYNYFH